MYQNVNRFKMLKLVPKSNTISTPISCIAKPCKFLKERRLSENMNYWEILNLDNDRTIDKLSDRM